MSRKADYRKLYDLLDKSDRYLLTSHMDPDGDSIGSLIGLHDCLTAMGKEVVIYNQGRLPDKYKFLDPKNLIRFSPEPPEFSPEVIMVLDCPKIERIGFTAELIKPGGTIPSGSSTFQNLTGKAEVITEKIELLLNNLTKLTDYLYQLERGSCLLKITKLRVRAKGKDEKRT